MKNNELVWRELVDAAVAQRYRTWDNVEDLAFLAGVAPTTAAYALRRPIEIGAVTQYSAGFTVTSPEKVLTLLCAARSLMKDARAIVTLSRTALETLISTHDEHETILGGCAAAVELLGGTNTVSDFSEHLFYFRNASIAQQVEIQLDQLETERHSGYGRDQGNVSFLMADTRAARTWGTHTSFAQTYADLFATPGWKATEFRLALHERYFGVRDWDQE